MTKPDKQKDQDEQPVTHPTAARLPDPPGGPVVPELQRPDDHWTTSPTHGGGLGREVE